ncbi:hypothetical protein T440DRAFT_317318 [Plenodomus tracheiphilus IPT5]|uniref:Uncharacterized protein n=1 Tax=Plenodomus tracheiphilus IPT5 TaxID=1408161 RepID=A0A6A7AQ75_9PLEO|nr:hypothetical protein T440DRAFT_317318 [Plenodomus tracheiphilus IPT5]
MAYLEDLQRLQAVITEYQCQITALKEKLAVYENHHAECRVATSTFQQREGEHPQSNASTLEVILYDVTGEATKANTSDTGTRSRTTKWNIAAHSFVQRLPTKREWDSLLVKVCSAAVASPLQRFLSAGDETLTPPGVESHLSGQRQTQDLAHLGQVLTIARKNARLLAKAQHAETVAQSSLFMFLSYCSALETLGLFTLAELNYITSEGIGSKTISERAKRYRDGALWMNKTVICGFVQAGWPLSQATLLVFHCKNLQSRPMSSSSPDYRCSIKTIRV